MKFKGLPDQQVGANALDPEVASPKTFPSCSRYAEWNCGSYD